MTSTTPPRHPHRTAAAARRAIAGIRQVNAELMFMSEIMFRPPGVPRPQRHTGQAAGPHPHATASSTPTGRAA
jgi:hypothetical protein